MKFDMLRKTTLLAGLVLFGTHAFAQDTQVNVITKEATTATPEAAASMPRTPEEDAIITKSIKELIANSKTLSKLTVDVRTSQGVVMLSGQVDSDSQASSLIEMAQSVVGVWDVDASKLTIKESQQPFTDMMITAKIKGLFMREKVFGGKDIAALNISVETHNGIVYLTGAIDNQDQLNNAIKMIEGVSGVKKVEYHVKKVTAPDEMQKTNGDTAMPASTNGDTTTPTPAPAPKNSDMNNMNNMNNMNTPAPTAPAAPTNTNPPATNSNSY